MTVKVKKMTQKQFDEFFETDEYAELHKAFYKAFNKVYNAKHAYDDIRRRSPTEGSFAKIRKAWEKVEALEAALPINPEAYEPGFKWN